MIKKYFTGIDTKGNFSTVSYDPLKKSWSIVDKQSKNRVYIVPADKMVYFWEKSDIKNTTETLNHYKLLLEEKYPNCEYDIHIDKEKNLVHVMVLKDFNIPKDYFALDGEIFSLKRLLTINNEESGYVFNFEEDKVVVVFVENSAISYYRIIKGINDINFILNQLPFIEKQKPLLVIGDIDYNTKKILSDYLSSSKIVNNSYSLATAVALKPVFESDFLTFKKSHITKEEFEKLKVATLGLALIYLCAFFIMSYFSEKAIKNAKLTQTQIFKSAFPDVPAVSPYQQLKAEVKTSLNFDLSKLLSQVDLPANSKIYSVEYFEGVLTVKGESSTPPTFAKSVKKTPSGNFEFEIEVK